MLDTSCKYTITLNILDMHSYATLVVPNLVLKWAKDLANFLFSVEHKTFWRMLVTINFHCMDQKYMLMETKTVF